MNELTILTNEISTVARQELSKAILKVCISITPKFYSNKTSKEMQSEKLSIELLTAGIDQEVLGLMCKLAIKQYPLERSRNERTYFDINYLLTFYEKAFNYYWCESVEIDRTCRLVNSDFNEYTNVLTETWERQDGNKAVVKCLIRKENTKTNSYERYYSPKYYANIYSRDYEF